METGPAGGNQQNGEWPRFGLHSHTVLRILHFEPPYWLGRVPIGIASTWEKRAALQIMSMSSPRLSNDRRRKKMCATHNVNSLSPKSSADRFVLRSATWTTLKKVLDRDRRSDAHCVRRSQSPSVPSRCTDTRFEPEVFVCGAKIFVGVGHTPGHVPTKL